MQSRRDFLKAMATFAAIPAVLSMGKKVFAQEKKKKGGGGFEFAIPGKGSAASLGYEEDKKKVPKASQVAKGGIAYDKQFCHNCILYKDGICQVMTDNNRKVKPDAWCNSWTHNPATPA